MHELTVLIKEDMKPALGVTEPAAIAFAVASARRHTAGAVRSVALELNSGMYKNAFTCGIPGSGETGIVHAAALGAVGADPDKGLECLDGAAEKHERQAKELAASGRITVEMTDITSRIFIKASVTTDEGNASVTIRGSHTNIVCITENGRTVFEKPAEPESADGTEAEPPLIHRYTVNELYSYAMTIPKQEIFFVGNAIEMNLNLCKAGLLSLETPYTHFLFKENGDCFFSKDERKTAALLCAAAVEARVLGISVPAMSITGSGAHGIIASLPIYASSVVCGYPAELMIRATALSFLICMYIKEYSGKLSSFCGCAIAAGTGAACGLTLQCGGSAEAVAYTINNMASGITGMICDGGNHGCVMKAAAAIDAAYRASAMAMGKVCIDGRHGINGRTPEQTMRNMGLIASPGMTGTEKTIIDILEHKMGE